MGTTALEVPKDQWRTSLEDVSLGYAGWGACVEVMGMDQPAAQGPPPAGISYETKGSEMGNILVEIGDAPDLYMVHRAVRPRGLRLAVLMSGEEADIRMESPEGTTTPFRLRRCPELPRGEHGRQGAAEPRRPAYRPPALARTQLPTPQRSPKP
jgi:hypothetical protein